MPVSFMNEAERYRLNRFPGQISDKDLVVFFALSALYKAQIRKQRGDSNRLGYSIQLCALRYLGFAPDDLKSIPWEALSYIAREIDIDPEVLHAYGNRIHTRTDHFNQVQKYLSFRKADSSSGRYVSPSNSISDKNCSVNWKAYIELNNNLIVKVEGLSEVQSLFISVSCFSWRAFL